MFGKPRLQFRDLFSKAAINLLSSGACRFSKIFTSLSGRSLAAFRVGVQMSHHCGINSCSSKYRFLSLLSGAASTFSA